MPLTRRETLAFRLSHRYKVKRSVFTLAIPAVVGILIFAYALYAGFDSVPFVGGSSTAAAATNATQNARLAAYEKIVAQYSPSSNSTTTNSTSVAFSSPKAAAPKPENFDFILLLSMGVGLGPYSADATLTTRRERKYEQDFTDFLFELSELVRGGIDPIKAITTLSEGSLGSITKPVRMVAKQMQIGYTFEQAMRNLGRSLNSTLVDRYIDLVIQASYSGGSVANLIQRASADMGTFIAIDKEKRAGLSQYAVILYSAQVILIALSAILVVQFFPQLSNIAGIGGTSLTGSLLGHSDIGSVPLSTDLYFLVVINGLLGGLVIGKISEGKIKYGIKHALVLMLIGFIAWAAFVIPASSGGAVAYNVTIVSYGQSGNAGLTMAAPVTVNVTNSHDAPAASVSVTFKITGPPGSTGAKVDPTTVITDSSGHASTTVTLGTLGGTYTVTAAAGSNSTSVDVTATALVGG